MKTPNAPSLYDLHEMYQDSNTKLISWKGTLHYALPYRICRHKKKVYEEDKRYPKGTFFIITDNGIKPIIIPYYKVKTNDNT